MTANTPPSANLYSQGFGTSSTSSLLPIISSAIPGPTNISGPNGPFHLGQEWIVPNAGGVYILTSMSASNGSISATWTLQGVSGGTLSTLTGNTGGAVSPTSNNINVVGSGSISVAGSGSTLTISSNSGSQDVVTVTGDTGGAVGPAAGGNLNLKGTSNEVTVTGNSGTNTLTISLPTSLVAPGSIGAATSVSSTTTMTAGTGLLVNTGNLTLAGLGSKILVQPGSNASIGTSGALSTGVVTVATTAVDSGSLIFLTRSVAAGTLGELSVGTITAGTSFTITSSSTTETSTVNWWIIN